MPAGFSCRVPGTSLAVERGQSGKAGAVLALLHPETESERSQQQNGVSVLLHPEKRKRDQCYDARTDPSQLNGDPTQRGFQHNVRLGPRFL